MRILRLVIIIPLLVVLVLFALSNTAPLRLGLWPTDYAVELPTSVVVLGAMGLAFLAGAFAGLGRRARPAPPRAPGRAQGPIAGGAGNGLKAQLLPPPSGPLSLQGGPPRGLHRVADRVVSGALPGPSGAERLIAALDTVDIATARAWAASIGPHCGLFKLGLEFFLANGAAGYAADRRG